MAISHSFGPATPTSATEVAGALNDIAQGLGLLDPTTKPEHLLTEGVGTGFGTWVRVFAARPDERDDLWTPARLAAVPRPYRRETHEFSEE
ncbi:hypothetical protein [Kitasatospora purpeofusca]|uniref:hypothetical protein n=1 Tax=Kitasatospora purpeofusca TaxID=67352 RepID=UPI00386F1A4E|nr:hypothetical protein OIP63_21605 [Kitasatospora purpeofusca]